MPRGGHFGLESGQYLVQERQGPLLLEKPLGCQRVGQFQAVTGLGFHPLQRHDPLSAASFLGLGTVILVGQEAFYRHQKKGAEPSFLAVGGCQKVLFQQPREELLGQILGFRGRVAATTDEGVKRIPVNAAELGHGCGCARSL